MAQVGVITRALHLRTGMRLRGHCGRLVVGASERVTGFEAISGYGSACNPSSKSLAGRPSSESSWGVYLEGLREAVRTCKRYWKPMMMTENGVADAADGLRRWFTASHPHQLQGRRRAERDARVSAEYPSILAPS